MSGRFGIDRVVREVRWLDKEENKDMEKVKIIFLQIINF